MQRNVDEINFNDVFLLIVRSYKISYGIAPLPSYHVDILMQTSIILVSQLSCQKKAVVGISYV